MPLDEEFIEVGKALLAAGDGGVGGDGLLAGGLGSLLHGVHLAGHLGEKRLVERPVVGEGEHPAKAQEPQRNPNEEQSGRKRQRQHIPQRRRHIGQRQKHAGQNPRKLF